MGEKRESEHLTADEEYAFYARAENQVPQGAPRPRRGRLTEPIPVRFSASQLAAIKARAEADDRSISAWIRRAVEHELERPA